MESEEQKQDGVSLSYIDILIFIIASKGNIHYNNSVYCYRFGTSVMLTTVLLDLSSSIVFQLDLVLVVSSYPFLLLFRIQVNAKKTWF